MKNYLLLLALLPALPALAQSPPPGAAPVPAASQVRVTRRYVSSNTPPEQRAAEETTILTTQLGLSSAQAERVAAAALIQARARQARLRQLEAQHAQGIIPLGPEDVAIENQFEAQLQAICTPAQYEHHLAMRARFRRLRTQADSLRRAQQSPTTPR